MWKKILIILGITAVLATGILGYLKYKYRFISAAIDGNQKQLKEYVLQEKLDPNIKLLGMNAIAFLLAQDDADKEVVELLLDLGTSPNSPRRFGVTNIQAALQMGRPDIAELLINRGADINEQTDKGYTALSYAIISNHTETALLLIDKGADINLKDGQNHTALDYAHYMDNKQIIEALIAHKEF